MAIVKLVSALITNSKPYRNCTTCDWFDEKTEICDKANSRPPAKVIVNGCEVWIEKLPF